MKAKFSFLLLFVGAVLLNSPDFAFPQGNIQVLNHSATFEHGTDTNPIRLAGIPTALDISSVTTPTVWVAANQNGTGIVQVLNHNATFEHGTGTNPIQLAGIPTALDISSVTTPTIWVANRTPAVASYPEAMNFGNVSVGSSSSRSLVFRNGALVGAEVLMIDNITIEDHRFTASSSSLAVAPSTSASVELTFTPDEINEITSDLVAETNDPNQENITVRLIGSGVSSSAPPEEVPGGGGEELRRAISVTPSAIGFPDTMGGWRSFEEVRISNTGNAEVRVKVESSIPIVFSFTEPNGFIVPVGRTITYGVVFRPSRFLLRDRDYEGLLSYSILNENWEPTWRQKVTGKGKQNVFQLAVVAALVAAGAIIGSRTVRKAWQKKRKMSA